MANEKMTERAFLNAVLAIEGIEPDLVAYATNRIADIEQKNANRRAKLTPEQLENEKVKEQIVANAVTDKVYTAGEIATAFNLKNTQKASALLRALVTEGCFVEAEQQKSANGKGKVKGYTFTGAPYVAKTNPEKTEG